MSIKVFISFDHANQKQIEAFNLLKDKTKHLLETHDHGCKEVLADGSVKSITCQVNDGSSKPVREEIIKKFEECSHLVVLIGDETHKNAWVEWEVNNFYKMKNASLAGKAWMKIRGMFIEGCEKAVAPKALESRSTQRLAWDLETLEKWIEESSTV
ncbi:MAG: TIR domain-containing protein [Candidatus Omnitrophica bacterium]|jgi:hypothetical protein|nr:TIR domain-containing protein [Candidatus Omnitrophota bacterium]MDD3987848.1 TIR domain-containing protein [Candidatus Omnitrophota bacterium]